MENNIYQNTISQKDEEYTEFLCWMLEQTEWENDVMIIHGKEYDRFMESDNDEEVMDMQIVESENFYNQFKEITNVDILRNEDNFVSMKYIGRNDINLIIRENGINQRFVIGV